MITPVSLYICIEMYRVGKYISILFLHAILVAKMSASFIIQYDYKENKDYISKYLCENRYKPSLSCEGKCLLMKKLQKAAETPESDKDQSVAKVLLVEFVEDLPSFEYSKSYTTTNMQQFIRTSEEVCGNFSADIFHPPIV